MAVLDLPPNLASALGSYKRVHRAELDDDPAFAEWLKNDYVPVAGGWHY
jgi:hypothetical protein